MATQQNAETKYVVANGVKLAYRRLGPNSGIPLVMLMHFRGNMDFWDPALINALVKSRPVLLLDNAGIGKSGGEVPTTFQGWAAHVIALLQALDISPVDLLGFSMGGAVAQHVALIDHYLVRSLILAGTSTSRNPNITMGNAEIFNQFAKSETEAELRPAMAQSFFIHDADGQGAANASWARIFERTIDRAPPLSPEIGKRQTKAFIKFSTELHPDNPYERVHELSMPVFVANGDNDVSIPTENSVELARILPNAHLHIYPNSGHGFLYQYAELFAKHIDLFLDGVGVEGGAATRKTIEANLA